jgi:tripartite-type tricarboxylate transporter receptor subunit TctC
MLHVPYKGFTPTVMETIAGTTQIMFPSLFTGFPQVKGGKLKALAIAEKNAQVFCQIYQHLPNKG